MLRSPDKQIRCFQKHLRTHFSDADLSVIVYGSSVNGRGYTRDTDMCVVLKRDDLDLGELKHALNACFTELDVRFYYARELANPVFFRDINSGTFAIEYLAGGVSLIGGNPFADLLTRISRPAYRRSLKQKMFDYVLRMRRVFLNKKRGKEELQFLHKYCRRVLIDLLLFNELESFAILNGLSLSEVLERAVAHRIIPSQFKDVPHGKRSDLFDYFFALNAHIGPIVFGLPDDHIMTVDERDS